ncbi:MAG: choice-of-anchor D domain-containing protein, partial [Bryobacteraceae bacterium]
MSSGETIQFPATPINDSAAALLVVTNRGSGPGLISLVTLAGSSFSVIGLTPPPTTVEGGRDVRFTIRYSPLAIESVTGSLRVDLIDRSAIFNLRASSTGAVFAYDVQEASTVSAVLPGQTIALPDALVGEKSSVVVRVRNTGNADGRLTTISVQGIGFSLSETPFLPLLMTPGSTAAFTVTFSPTTPGRVPGRLRVGTDDFNLTGGGLGPTLLYAYIAGSVNTVVTNNGSIIFPTVVAGGNSSVRVVVTNNGTAPGAINSVSVVTTGTLFSLGTLPSLPGSIGPGESVSFAVTFAPEHLAAQHDALQRGRFHVLDHPGHPAGKNRVPDLIQQIGVTLAPPSGYGRAAAV